MLPPARMHLPLLQAPLQPLLPQPRAQQCVPLLLLSLWLLLWQLPCCCDRLVVQVSAEKQQSMV